MFQALYDSPFWLPILPTLTTTWVLVAVRRGTFGTNGNVRAFAVVFAVLAAADAWLNGPCTPLGPGPLATASAVAFVILGDLRYFLATRLGAIPLRPALLRATLWSLVVPVGIQLGVRLPFPDLSARALFLAYELAMLVVLTVEHRRVARGAESTTLYRFLCVQYALWAAADVLVLRGLELGHLLRIVPNVMYYAAFVPVAARVLQRPRAMSLGAIATTALLLLGCQPKQDVPHDVALRFSVDGKPLRTLGLAALAAKAPPVVVTTDDPYYAKAKHFRAISLESVLALGFEGTPVDGRQYVLRAKDGYAVPFDEPKLHETGGYLAFADEDVVPCEPIGPQGVSPFPLYLVWTGAGQNDLEKHPRPWQLESIELVRFEVAYPHLAPPPQPALEKAQHGLAIYRAQCFKCHAINREGGHIGPELNVPKNVLEYLPEAFVRAYVVKPSDFRYGVMPSHESLTPSDLDDLLQYLRSMKDAKFDPH